jgi:uncharacterized protein (TIGR02145 family)
MKNLSLLLALLCVTALAQTPKKTVAVYMDGKEPAAVKGAHTVLGTELAKALTKSGEYTAVDRTAEALKIVSNEQVIQRSGMIDPKQVKKLGKQLGVDIVCIAKITEVMKKHYLEARLIDVETAEILKVASEIGNMSDASDIVRTAQAAAQELVSGVAQKEAIGKTVVIDSQTWMAENLNYDVEGSKCYDNDPANCAKYGRLYDWETAKKVCPSGWHLPSKGEWGKLFEAVGGEKVAGKKLKAKSGWREGGNGTDEYGFSALPGGHGGSKGRFGIVGYRGFWWSDSHYYYTWCMYNSYDGALWDIILDEKNGLFSVRCIKD